MDSLNSPSTMYKELPTIYNYCINAMPAVKSWEKCIRTDSNLYLEYEWIYNVFKQPNWTRHDGEGQIMQHYCYSFVTSWLISIWFYAHLREIKFNRLDEILNIFVLFNKKSYNCYCILIDQWYISVYILLSGNSVMFYILLIHDLGLKPLFR